MRGWEQPSEERVSGEADGLAPPASPSLASLAPAHTEYPPAPQAPSLPAGRMLTPSWSFTLFFPERAMGRGFVLSIQLFSGSLALSSRDPTTPSPCLTRSRPEFETPDVGLISLSPEPRKSVTSGLKKALLSLRGKERRVEKGGGPGWTQTSGAPGLRPLVSMLCCGQRAFQSPHVPHGASGVAREDEAGGLAIS